MEMNIVSSSSSNTKTKQRMLLAWVKDPDMASIIDAVTGDIEDLVCTVQIDDDPVGQASQKSAAAADIILVEIPDEDEQALRQVELMAQAWRDNASIVVMLNDPTTETVRRLFRSGVSDVLPAPCPAEDLAPTLMQASQSTPSKPERKGSSGKLVTVLKSSGGVGASTIAANLAAEAHAMTGEKVCLVDLDVQFGSLALQLDIRPRRTLLEALRAGTRLDQTMISSMVETHKTGIDLLAAPPAITPLDRISENFLASLLRLLKSEYRIVIVEMPSGWTDWVSGVFEQSDLLLIASEPTVRGASGIKRVMQCLRDLSFIDAPSITVVNKVKDDADNKERVSKLKDTLEKEVEVIHADFATAGKAADMGILLSEANPASVINKDIRSLSEKVLERISIPVIAEDPREKSRLGLGSLLRRRS